MDKVCRQFLKHCTLIVVELPIIFKSSYYRIATIVRSLVSHRLLSLIPSCFLCGFYSQNRMPSAWTTLRRKPNIRPRQTEPKLMGVNMASQRCRIRYCFLSVAYDQLQLNSVALLHSHLGNGRCQKGRCSMELNSKSSLKAKLITQFVLLHETWFPSEVCIFDWRAN